MAIAVYPTDLAVNGYQAALSGDLLCDTLVSFLGGVRPSPQLLAFIRFCQAVFIFKYHCLKPLRLAKVMLGFNYELDQIKMKTASLKVIKERNRNISFLMLTPNINKPNMDENQKSHSCLQR